MSVTARKRTSSKVSTIRGVAEAEPKPTKPTIQLRVFRLMTKFAMVAAVWTSAGILATRIIPYVGATLMVLSGGVSPSHGLDAFLATWVVPLLFVVGLLFWFEVVGIKWFWAKIKTLDEKAAEWPLMKPYDKTNASRKSGKDDKDSDVA